MAMKTKYSRTPSLWWISRNRATATGKTVIGFLAFEISALMARTVQIWNRLEDKEFTRVKEQLVNSAGLRKLVSEHDNNLLMELFLKEIVGDLKYVAVSITRFGKNCSDPVIHEFEQFVKDPINNEFEWFGWQYKWKKMERRMKKMQRFVGFTTELSRELDVLVAVERTVRRSPATGETGGGGRFVKFKQRVSWHRRQVKDLKEMTPWTRNFDYILRLFMRSIITIIERIKIVFQLKEMPFSGEKHARHPPTRQRTFSSSPQPASPPARNFRRMASEPSRRDKSTQPSKQQNHSKNSSQFAQIRSFKNCKDDGPHSPVGHGCQPTNCTENGGSSPRRINGGHYSISSFFSKDRSPASPPSTLGGAALAVHYAKMIIIIEKFAEAPHLIGIDERDELYGMLPKAVRTGMRSRLNRSAKIEHPSVYDPVLAAEWKSAAARILRWLAPLAHNTEAWHCEQSFERRNVVGSSELLVQTLHYANKEKTEGALMEVLVALSNICSAGEVEKKRLSCSIGIQACRGYFCRRDEFSF